MKTRFIYELIVGVLGLMALFIFGESGLAVFALLAAHPFIGKKKADEREFQLFYKTGNLTGALLFLACVAIYLASDYTVVNLNVGKNWLQLEAFSFLAIHGVSGLVVFKRG